MQFKQQLINLLKEGGVAVIPTDTLYGIVGSALLKETVEIIYRLRQRTPSKPTIILISSLKDLKLFNVTVDAKTEKFLEKVWPGPVSVILPCPEEKFSYLHRGTNTLAFRLPDKKDLRKLLQKTGPLVAPSANLEGEPPAQTIREAKKYFGDEVQFYVDGGKLSSLPSTLIKIDNGNLGILREGAYPAAKLKEAFQTING